MKKTIKTGLSLALAASMVVSGTPAGVLGATGAKNNTKAIFESHKSLGELREKKFNKNAKAKKQAEYAEGEALIMYYSDKVSKNSIKSKLSKDCTIEDVCTFDDVKKGSISKSSSFTGKTGKDLTISRIKSDKMSTEELVQKYSADKDILVAEPNYIYKASKTNDTMSDLQWALDNKGQDAGIEGLDINSDSDEIVIDSEAGEKVIAIIDTGVDYEHEDLQDVMWNNPYAGTKTLKGLHGYDFVDRDEDPMDENGHGTHCLGIMHANIDNEKGIAGVTDSENIKIMALRFLDADGYGYGEDAIDAYNYIYRAQQLGIDVVSINNSWGGGGSDEILDALIELVGENGAVSVFAAGNEGNNNDDYNMSSTSGGPYALSVAASDSKGELAGFSNYGGETVDIAAPGSNILSTVSYDCFNPITYDAAKFDKLVGDYKTFDDNQKLVQYVDNDGFTGNVADENDLRWGVTASGDATYSVEYTDEEFVGPKDGNKSIKISLKNAKDGDSYYFYFPYTAEKSSKPLYQSEFIRAELGENYKSDSVASICVADSTLDEDGVYDEENENWYGRVYASGEDYYDWLGRYDNWTYYSVPVIKKAKATQERVLAIQIFVSGDGDYNTYVDVFGMSKGDVDSKDFGKYDWYCGTSMATPHVTAAAAVVAAMNPDYSAADVKDTIIGCTTDTKALEGKCATGGMLDLSKVNNPNFSVRNIENYYGGEDDELYIAINGAFLEGTNVTVNGNEVEAETEKNCIVFKCDEDMVNSVLNIAVSKGDKTVEKQYFVPEGKEFNSSEYEGFETSFVSSLVKGDDCVYFVNVESGNVYKGIAPEKFTDHFEWMSMAGNNLEELFGLEYAMNYSISYSNPIYKDGYIFATVNVDLGYAEYAILVAYDTVNEYWDKVAEIPADVVDSGCDLLKYNDTLYLYGSDAYKVNGQFERDEAGYAFDLDAEFEKTNDLGVIPEKGLGREVFEIGDKLVSPFHYDYPDEGDTVFVPAMIFDGNSWKQSEADINVIKNEAFVATATENGIVYTGIYADKLGDTFIYDADTDSYSNTDYHFGLEEEMSDYSYIFKSIVVDGRLFVIKADPFNFGDDEFDDEDDWSNRTVVKNDSEEETTSDDYDDEYEDEEESDSPTIYEYNVNLVGEDIYEEPIEIETTTADSEIPTENSGNNNDGETTAVDTTAVETTAPVTADETTKPVETTTAVPTTTKPVETTTVAPTTTKAVETTTASSITKKKAKITKVKRTSKKKAKITVKAVANVKYQVKYSTSKKFSKKTTKTLTFAKNAFTISKLKANKKYYVKVRFMAKENGKDVFGKWSAVKTIKK
ncbi:MAG: S8 family serine peptidase [Lachnospiraceae bacterium]|nr:S8 family serine peptidase [Lachnospiraceae bacterium]